MKWRYKMIASKHFSKIVAAVVIIALLLCGLAMAFGDKLQGYTASGITMEYETALFDTSEPIEINIKMSEEDWKDLLEHALDEEYYSCDVVVNGTTFTNVGIRAKGNTSLSNIANDPDTDRYSLKLEFDHYVDGQTCFGLDKLILNNNYADATNMKEALVYDMYQYLGADASLYNYAKISVNGEYWGVYLALEAVDDSFMLRNYGTQDGELYKPESMDMSGKKDSDISDKFEGGERPTPPDGEKATPPDSTSGGGLGFGGKLPEGGPGGGFGSGGGADLNYVDDELDSYSTIWDGSITDTTDSDHRRVVTALKNISEGTDLEKYMDIDNILKYMAVHTFVVNADSLSGNMAHNYYLYEYNGQLNILPWDYNLSFGGMGQGGSDASGVINDAIDTPFSSTDFFDKLLENEEYLAQYHEYLRILAEEYVGGGVFDEFIENITSQIDALVATDPTAFYTAEEYNAAKETLVQVVKLRAESVLGQLDGTIPATDEGQKAGSSALITASGINLSTMGQMGGGGQGGPGGGFGDKDSSDENSEGGQGGPGGNPPEGMTPPDGSTAPSGNASPGEPPEGFSQGNGGGNAPSGQGVPGGTPPDGFTPPDGAGGPPTGN